MSDKSSSSDSDNLSTVAEDGDASDVDEKIPIAKRGESRSRSPPLKVHISPVTRAPPIISKQNEKTEGNVSAEEKADSSFPTALLIAAFIGGTFVGVFFALYIVLPVQQVLSELATVHDDAAVEVCTTNQPSTCDDGWTYIEEADKCYKVIRAAMAFHEAHFSCRVLGAQLASIHSEQENQLISNTSSRRTDGVAHAWIGLYNPTRDDDGWTWTDGSEMAFQKDISYCNRNDACGAIVTDDPRSPSTVGHWIPAECSSVFWAICSKSPHRLNDSGTD